MRCMLLAFILESVTDIDKYAHTLSMVSFLAIWECEVRPALEAAAPAGDACPEGTQFVNLPGAANRDLSPFTDPDRFDVGRDEGTPMSFAAGIHYCLGANLARVEGREVFRALRDRFSAIELAGELVQRPRTTLRGYEAVPVRVTPR